jgi:hypothetical protein
MPLNLQGLKFRMIFIAVEHIYSNFTIIYSSHCIITRRVRTVSPSGAVYIEKVTPADFVELDRKYGLLLFIENGYEPFHLTGTEGVLDEVEGYIRIQREHQE